MMNSKALGMWFTREVLFPDPGANEEDPFVEGG